MLEKKSVLALVEKLKCDVKEEVFAHNLEIALELIYSCAKILYETNVYYVDNELEADLKTISDMLTLSHPTGANKNTLLFYDGFGLNDRGLAQIYLEALCRLRDVVYVTYDDRKDDIPDLLQIISEHDGCKAVYIKRKGQSFREQIHNLNSVLLAERPAEFFFYSTPSDVVAMVVMNSYEGLLKRYQVNLTDHAFWLGAKCIDVCIEFRDYGASISKKYRGIPENHIVKLPYYLKTHPEREFQGYPFKVKEGQKVVFSGGSLYKTLGGNYKYYEVVDHLLSAHEDVIFWYAGSGDDTELKKILVKYPKRAYHTAERSDLFQVLQHARFYLSTYPICGGLMYQFAASAGRVPVTLKFDDCSEGLLLNQEHLNVDFEDAECLYREADRLLNDNNYFLSRQYDMQKAVISREDFYKSIKSILSGDASTMFSIKFTDINTEKFRYEYLKRLDNDSLNMLLANTKTIKSSLKHTPVHFIRRGGDYEENSYDVSIVVTTYNPRWEAEKATLDSILKQKNTDFEIILADDGSADNCFSLVNSYFAEHNFTNFKLVANPVNKGTVYNFYSGVSIATGKYIKSIAPGDMLYKEDTLRIWIDFMEARNLEWSFSEVIYYQNLDGNITPIKVGTHPKNTSVYNTGDEKAIRWQYFVLSDIAVGASMLGLRELMVKYCEEILGKVIYAEDNIWRMMMFDGVVGGFFNRHTVLYEYGFGISTSKSSVWSKRLLLDWGNTDKILSARQNLDNFQLKMKKAYALSRGSSKLKKLFIKGRLKNRIFYSGRKSIDYLPEETIG